MSDRLYVATRKGLFGMEKAAGGKGDWKVSMTAFLGAPVSMVLPDARDGSLYAAVGHGHFGAKLQRSTDGGATWIECAAPVYPERPADVEPIMDPNRGIEIPWSLEMIWSLETGGPDQPGVLWCGTIPGGLFRSADHGSTWELVRSLWDNPNRRQWFGGGYDYPGIHSVCVDPRDSRRITIGISCGGVWVSEDLGETWNCRAKGMRADYMPPELQYEPNIQDPHRVVQCHAAPDHLWTQHHNGVFRSTDGAASWHSVDSIRPSGFGFAVAVHPAEPRTAWFVPGVKDEQRIPVDGQVVVARTRDGGESFEVLREGLPQEHAYDLVFRHALDIDKTGERLAFGSTTGSLWTSDDQGDRWRHVTGHLPPVHAVRFA